MANDDNPLPSLEEILNNTSQSSSSGTTGLSSYNITNGYNDLGMEESRGETKTGSGVDQGADNLETPRALYTAGGDLPRTGYEPKPSSTKVVGGAFKQTEGKNNQLQVPLVPPLCHALVGTLGK